MYPPLDSRARIQCFDWPLISTAPMLAGTKKFTTPGVVRFWVVSVSGASIAVQRRVSALQYSQVTRVPGTALAGGGGTWSLVLVGVNVKVTAARVRPRAASAA